MVLTKKDLEKLSEVFATKQDLENLSKVFATKKELAWGLANLKDELLASQDKLAENLRGEFLASQDKIIKKLEDISTEQKMGFAQYKRQDAQIEDHEKRIGVLEVKVC